MLRKLLLGLLMPGLGALLQAQDVGRVPGTYPAEFLLKGATVVVGNGQVLEKADIWIQDGLIRAVGTSVQASPNAWVLDLEGKFVYPGLIDTLTEVGLKKQTGEGAPQRGGRPQAASSPEGPGLFPHVRAADQLEEDTSRLRSWRENGVLSLNVAPDRGIFMGQTALVNLGEGPPDQRIVKGSVAMRMSFQSMGFRVFPGSLMGVIAHIRQTLLDAAHYGQAWAIYAASPRGLRRPQTDRALEALQPVVQGKMALVFPAKLEREIQRALDLGQETGTRVMVAGGFEAPLLAQQLREREVPVLLSLNFPEKEKDAHPESDDPLRLLKYRRQAREAARQLDEAGVAFAFYSDGLQNASDFLKNLRSLVKEGLPKEAALRAATLSAAEILGAEAQLGSLEAGKIANLVVADGDLFGEESKLLHVFVDGEKYDVPAQPRRDRQAEGERPSVSGLWEVRVTTPEMTYRLQFDLRQQGGQVRGRVLSPEVGELSLYDGRLQGRNLSFKFQVDFGMGPQEVTVEAEVQGDQLSGTAAVSGMGVAPLEGERAPGLGWKEATRP